MSYTVLPSYSHGHFGYHCTYGQSLKEGCVPNNFKNYNDLIDRIFENRGHGYFKPSFCHWPKGGYTRKEARHNHCRGKLDTNPQSFEWDRLHPPEDVGLTKGASQSSLCVRGEKVQPMFNTIQADVWGGLQETGAAKMGPRLTSNSLSDHDKKFKGHSHRPKTAPSVGSNSTLHLATYVVQKGCMFEPRPKPARHAPAPFAPRPASAHPALGRSSSVPNMTGSGADASAHPMATMVGRPRSAGPARVERQMSDPLGTLSRPWPEPHADAPARDRRRPATAGPTRSSGA